jgi:hypothetical protein
MLKRVTVLLIIASLIFANFSRLFVYADFALNHQYIVDNFCVNKGKPWMHCNGRCYLMKKIKAAEQKEQRQERTDQKNHYLEFLFVLLVASIIAYKNSIVKIAYSSLPALKPIKCSFDVLQPPQ